MNDDDIPLIDDAYRARVAQLIRDKTAACADGGGSYYDRVCLAGWVREWERLERGEIY